jgi:hypothetical protein
MITTQLYSALIKLCNLWRTLVQLVEIYCLSEAGYHAYMEGIMHKYGPIARFWIGPYLGVFLAEAKYVEVSEVALVV